MECLFKTKKKQNGYYKHVCMRRGCTKGVVVNKHEKYHRMCDGIGVKQSEPIIDPSMLDKVRNFATAFSRWKTAGRPVRSEEEISRIFNECCKPCEEFNPVKQTCRLCGCRCKDDPKAFLNKIKWATEDCPKGKWARAEQAVGANEIIENSNKVDVVIPLSDRSLWGDNELRYALRSLEKNLLDLGRVFIVGHKPDWITNVEHIPAEDVYKRGKDANLFRKVLMAIDAGCSWHFIRQSDDQCLLKPVYGRDLLPRYSHELKENPNANGWWQRMERTRAALADRGYPTKFYDCHMPTLYDAGAFHRAANQFDWETPPSLCINTLYCNSTGSRITGCLPLGGATINEREKKGTADEIVTACSKPEKLCFNYNGKIIAKRYREALQKMFPKKSRFELDDVSAALNSAITHGKCSEASYREILAWIEKRRPCNVLIFGCGADSKLWQKANDGGRTLFIESNRRWARLARKDGCEVIVTTYDSQRDVDAPDGPPPDELRDVLNQAWDIVFIDGPKGNKLNTPGRELPIRWTSRLPGAPLVFLHDYKRSWENYNTKKYFKSEPLRTVGQLAVWQLAKHQTLAVVAGPPRSGSSCVAGILHHLGVPMGDKFLQNGSGTYEDVDLANYLESIFRGRRNPSNTKEDRMTWLSQWLAKGKESSIRGCKYHFLNFLLSELAELKPNLKVIGTNRPTQEIEESRKQLGWRNKGCVQPEEYCRSRDEAISQLSLPSLQLGYHDVITNPRKTIDKIIEFLGLSPSDEQISNAITHIQPSLCHFGYRTEVPDYVWTYWDGTCPAWIELCFETMKENIPGINILTPTTFAKLYAEHRSPDDPYDLLSSMPTLSRACQRSNIIRTWLLKTLGGVWIDADCIVLSDVRKLCRKYMGEKDLVTYKYKNKFSVDALLMSRPNGQVINECFRLQKEVLQPKKYKLDRMAIGPPILEKAISTVGESKIGIVPTELIDPARGGRNHKYLRRGKLPNGCACVMLRSGTGKNRELWTRERWLDPGCYLSAVLRRALGIEVNQ